MFVTSIVLAVLVATAQRELAIVLARSGERRWKYLMRHYFYLWVPDAEDLAESF